MMAAIFKVTAMTATSKSDAYDDDRHFENGDVTNADDDDGDGSSDFDIQRQRDMVDNTKKEKFL